jgi:hypothetical protein
VELGDELGDSLGLELGETLGLALGASLGDSDGEADGDKEGAELFVGLSDGALLGKYDPLGSALGSPHSTLIVSHGISTLYAQNSPPISLKSSTLQASHSSGSKSLSINITIVNPVTPF